MRFGKAEKVISVTSLPQNQKYVPFIRIAGDWLLLFGFEREDKVLVKAENERIIIEKLSPTLKNKITHL